MIKTLQPEPATEPEVTAGGFTVEIGGIRVSVNGAGEAPGIYAAGPVRNFLTERGGRPDLAINVSWGDLKDECAGNLLFDPDGVWRLYEDGGSYLIRFAAPFSNWRPYKLARFNREWTSGEIICNRAFFDTEKPVYPLEYPLDELLFINMLSRGRGVEIHGCAVVDADGRGYLFPGQSGAGKSTTAGLWRTRAGVKILSDERVVLRQEGGRVWIYGTPWHGDARLAMADKAPLAKIFFLARGLSNRFVELSEIESAARLFACSFPPFHSPEGLEFTLQFLDEVTSSVECGELKFVPDERVVDFVRAVAGQPSRALPEDVR